MSTASPARARASKRKGNYIPGPGRPPGAKNKRTVAREEAMKVVGERIGQVMPELIDVDAHELLRLVYRDPGMPVLVRIEAARAALRVEKPALAATALTGELTLYAGIADRLGAARQRAAAVDVRATPALDLGA